MGFLLKNLLSKFMKPKSDVVGRIFSPAGDLNRKQTIMLLIEHNDRYWNSKLSLLSAADADNSWKDRHHTVCTPFAAQFHNHHLVGSCKEWTLFSSYGMTEEGHSHDFYQDQEQLTLWDPTTNRVKRIPPSSFPRTRPVFCMEVNCCGFGFDPKSQEHKLLCFRRYSVCDVSWASNHHDGREASIELYSLKTGTWKQITAPPHVSTPSYHQHIHINGVNFWAKDDILSFDFADEKFSRISLPDAPQLTRKRDNYIVAEYHGSLAVIVYWVPSPTTEEEIIEQHFCFEIWVWNGETWDVEPRVAIINGDDRIDRLVCLFRNEYLFLEGKKDTDLMLFNCKTGELENLGIHHDPPYWIDGRRRIFPCTVPI